MVRFIGRLRTFLDDWFHPVAVTMGVFTLLAVIFLQLAFGAPAQQKIFPSAEEAVRALIDAARGSDTQPILDILGPDAKAFIETGDLVSDRQSREGFVKSYEASHALVKASETKFLLQVGKDKWPFPIPIVKEGSSWRFDTKQGQEEILNRQIGRNELDVIQVCLAYVDAQQDYYRLNPLKEPLPQYAQKLLSTNGKRDGLYWEAAAGEARSPLGPLVAQARIEGYKDETGKPVSYHGYYYKILTRQGPNAQGGAYDYIVRGKMFGGFGMVAYPAQYGSSGIMTFIVNHDGVVFEKDLGPNTAQVAGAMSKFNPDKTWKEAAKIR